MRFALILSFRTSLIACVMVICALLALDQLDLLRYPLIYDLLIGAGITLFVAFTLTLVTSLYIGYGVMQLATTRREFQHQSRTDMLSGLLNRRAFIAEMGEDTKGHLLLLDIDRFKQINDRFGHMTGDDVIIAVAETLRLSIGPQHLVARIGGEEFAVFFRAIEEIQVVRLAEKARHAIASMEVPSELQIIRVTISGGLACLDGERSFAEAYACADRALYCAKAAGRNRLVSERELDPVIAERLSLRVVHQMAPSGTLQPGAA